MDYTPYVAGMETLKFPSILPALTPQFLSPQPPSCCPPLAAFSSALNEESGHRSVTGGGRMEVLEEREEEEHEEEQEEEEQKDKELKPLEISDKPEDLKTKESVERVCVPSDVPDFDWSSIDTSQLPSSYKTNSPSEEKLLHVAAHFLQQYTHICPDRKPLFLHPVNECGVEKFVSTTVRPTLLPYTELYHWDGCASFVSDYLIMEPLKSPITPPSSLYSPTTILKYQRGNCFDFSVLLCSMLIGAGYDAYCVHGYATREICTLDETLEVCPLLRKTQEVPKEEIKKSNKYRIKSPPDLQSKFELQQKAKKAKKAETEAAQKDKERGEEMVMKVEKPKGDPLHGLRVHAWVLVLSGKREVPETFFINPFTGNSHSTTDEQFLGIESIWNHRNYWVNMQDCWNGCKDLVFDLSDNIRWEVMLSGSDKPHQLLPDAEEKNELPDNDMDDVPEPEDENRNLDMPPSWVDPIQISPRGSEVVEVKEWFTNREDMLDLREVNKRTQLTTDYFSPGHRFHLKAHTYMWLEPETENTMEFYNEARVDGLQKRVQSAMEMTEYFVGRDDFLHVRYTEFGKRGKKVHLAGMRADANARPIVQIKECFHRNPEKPADEDVAERIFLITEEMIHLTYHLKDNYLTASQKDFFKIPEGEIRGREDVMTPDMCITYQAGFSKEEKLVHLYKMLQELIEVEKQLKEQVRRSEAEVLNILKTRENEENSVKLLVSIYDTERNEKRRQEYEAMKKSREDDLLGQEGQDLDYLAPFLLQTGNTEKITKAQALRLRNDCLADLKRRLVNKANIIQARFDKAVEELQKKDEWFQENQDKLSEEEEEEFLARYSETTFLIHILSLRLRREKETAPQKYLALEEKLRKDPRFAEHLGHA
ncbi:dynein regulatory complex subunit 7 isoform X2 [Columba livia]|uniref:dynein regulatory complex subunit 7 isoform X2 n=2 Tax=Columba livia TaxID=8932 RepID=UPI0031B9FA7D